MVYLSDSINNLKPLKAMGKEEAFATLLENKALGIRKETRRGIDSGLGMKGGQEILFTLAMGGGLFVAITIWNVPLVELVVVGVVLSRTLNGFNKIQNLIRKAAGQQSPYLALEQLFRETAAAREESVGQRVSTFEHECTFENVTFGYNEEVVLHSVSMSIPANSTTVLIGPSGSGKTTLIDLVIGLYRPRKGKILIDGVPMTSIDIKSWRRHIGYVPQELVLFHDTVLANINLGDQEIGEKEALEALKLAGALEFIDQLP
jgi:ATP-binding cassette subfamily C protein